MDLWSIALLALMGVLAGIINAAVGSGSLLTLPVLLALGLPPGEAVRTNTVGMSFATIGSVLGFRREIAAERAHVGPLTLVTVLCAMVGSLLLLFSPSSALDVVVPVLIVVALVLVVLQPTITRRMAARRARRATDPQVSTALAQTRADAQGPVGAAYRRPEVIAPMGLAAVYGGYFTAAQGILYTAILGTMTGRSPKAINPVKNLMQLVVNIAAAVVYISAFVLVGSTIAWWGVLTLAVSGLIGGFAGSHIAKRLPNSVLRAAIVAVALAALFRQLLG